MKKVLVVEDNDQNMYLMQYMLETAGYAVICARTGREGLALASGERPDLILMDIQLADMDGLAVTRLIRASEGVGPVPIVAVTSFAMAGDRQKALAAGCTGYVEKPIDPETFLSEVAKYCPG